jgi:glycosyltransferase involved in cell wall biosynthesis
LENLAGEPSRHDDRLRILQVCSARNATYGAVASMMTLAGELRSRGHDVAFATFKGRRLGDHVRTQGFESHEVRVRFKIDPFAIASIARFVRRSKVDVVHSHLSTSSVNGSFAARLANVPGVATVHGMSGKLSFLPAHHLIAVSGEVRRHLIQQGVHESKISIVPNGIEFGQADAVARSAARARLGVDDHVPLIGTTARLTPLKGVDHALYALAKVVQDLPHAQYVVFGSGPEAENLRELAETLGIAANVRFEGYREDVTELLPGLDVFLFPSLREAMGIAIVEAMSAGIPTVATRIGGIPEVLAPETGTLVAPSDPVAMSEALLSYLRDPELRSRVGKAAGERARSEYTAQRMASRTVDVYRAVLDRKQRG